MNKFDFAKRNYTGDSSVIIQLNSVQVLLSSDSISAFKSMTLQNSKCFLDPTKQTKSDRDKEPKLHQVREIKEKKL